MSATRIAIAALLVLACACQAAAGGRAQVAGRDDLDGIGWLPSEVFDVGEGLPDPAVNAIATLPNGQVWLGTMRGLARMNGARIVPEAGPGDVLTHSILDLAATPRGNLFASVEGDGVLLREGGVWRSIGSPFGAERTQRLRVFVDGKRERVFATGAGELSQLRGLHRTRIAGAACITQGGHVIDINAQLDHFFASLYSKSAARLKQKIKNPALARKEKIRIKSIS